jgi:hypothetical protein
LEYLAREAQQQAGQQDVGQERHELIANEIRHGFEYIGSDLRMQA